MEWIVLVALQGVQMKSDPSLSRAYMYDAVGRTLHLHPNLSLVQVADICKGVFPVDGSPHWSYTPEPDEFPVP